LRGREGVRNERGPGFLTTIARAPFVATTLRQLYLEVALGDGAVLQWVVEHCAQLTHLTISTSPRPFTEAFGAVQWGQSLTRLDALEFIGARGWGEFLLFDRLNHMATTTTGDRPSDPIHPGSALLRLPQIRSTSGFADAANGVLQATLPAFVEMFPNLSRVKVTRVSDPGVITVHLPRLRLLHQVDLSESAVDDRCVAALLVALPLLTDLEISRGCALDNDTSHKTLTLSIDGLLLEAQATAAAAARATSRHEGDAASAVSRLVLKSHRLLTSSGLDRHASALLDEAGEALRAFSSRAPLPLRRLAVRHCAGLRLEGLTWIARACLKLRRLDIRGCPNVRVADLSTAFLVSDAFTPPTTSRSMSCASGESAGCFPPRLRLQRLRELQVTRHPLDDAATCPLPAALEFCTFSSTW
jgi:hypothetical protein